MSKEKLDEIFECQVRTEIKVSDIDEKVDRCLIALYGPAEQPETGLTVKVDRLEQTEKRRSTIVWAVILGMVGLLCETIFAVIRR